MPTLNADDFRHYIDRFNAMEPEGVVNLVPNSQSWDWVRQNAPLFSCPDKALEEIYYFRWWTFRKHIKQTPAGTIVTEFIEPVRHAGSYNSISCALGHHLAEGRWLRDQRFLDEYVRFWFRSNNGGPEEKFHNYSSWVADAMVERASATGDRAFVISLLDDLIGDFHAWERERLLPNGLFWQYDVRDGMEESITGSRVDKNARPTINSYMFANARAIAQIAAWANRGDVVDEFTRRAVEIKQRMQQMLWDPVMKFFKAQKNEAGLSDAREAIGFVPWCFRLPDAGFEDAWAQLPDEQGFWAPMGITTAERRHPQFRSHGVGKCEWDGACWPFATSQSLGALANVLRYYKQSHVTSRHYFDSVLTYAKAQHWGQQPDSKPYVGEYYDEVNGDWLKGDNPRSRYYNHSTFCDLIIAGIAGVCPRADNVVEIDPLLPGDAWDWFALEGVPYHGKSLSIVWDRNGKKFGRDTGLSVLVDGKRIAQRPELAPLEGSL
jgi:hypothetical protein